MRRDLSVYYRLGALLRTSDFCTEQNRQPQGEKSGTVLLLLREHEWWILSLPGTRRFKGSLVKYTGKIRRLVAVSFQEKQSNISVSTMKRAHFKCSCLILCTTPWGRCSPCLTDEETGV